MPEVALDVYQAEMVSLLGRHFFDTRPTVRCHASSHAAAALSIFNGRDLLP